MKAMTIDQSLKIASAVVTFLFRTSAAFAMCGILNQLVRTPNRKFQLWFGLLLGSSAYWIYSGVSLFTSATGFAHLMDSSSISPSVSMPHIQLPAALLGAVRAALWPAVAFYICVLCVQAFMAIRRRILLKRLFQHGIAPSETLLQLFHPIAQAFHLSNCSLRVLPDIVSPATFGWIRPTVLLPEHCLEQSKDELTDILWHELIHVMRRDYLCACIAGVCRALLIFHPAAWYACRRMQVYRELACDDAVIHDRPARRIAYAESLLHFAKINMLNGTHFEVNSIDFASKSRSLNQRVRAVLAGSARTSWWSVASRSTVATILLACFWVAAPLAAIAFIPYTAVIRRPASPISHPKIVTARAHFTVSHRTHASSLSSIHPDDSGGLSTPTVQIYDSVTATESPRSSALHAVDEQSTTEPTETEQVATQHDSKGWDESIPIHGTNTQSRSISSVIVGIAGQLGRMERHDHDKDFR
jgi:beta-lactamase regulating signal transducer with metallopeptidase domain